MKKLLIILCLCILCSGLTINVYASDNGDYGLTDVMKDMSDNNSTADGEVLEQVTSPFTQVVGTLLSVFVYLIFALQFCWTALDLIYVSIPVSRNYLYKKQLEGQEQDSNTKVVCFLSRDMKQMVDTGYFNSVVVHKSFIKNYLVVRAKGLVIFGVVVGLLLFSTIFTDCGLNIGKALLSALGL